METSASKDISYSDKFQGAHPHTPRYFYESYCFSVTGKLAVFFILTGKTTAIQQDANTKPGGRTRREVWLLYLFSNAVQNLIHLHASRVPVVPKPNDDHAVFFRKDGLIHLPAIMQVREHVRHLEPTGLRGSGGKSPASSSQPPHGTPKVPPAPRSLTTEPLTGCHPAGPPPHRASPRGPYPAGAHPAGPPPHGASPRSPRPTGTHPEGQSMRCRQGQARVYQVPTPSPPQERLCPPAKIPRGGAPWNHTPAHHSPTPSPRLQPRTHLCPHRALPLSGPSGRVGLPEAVSAGH